MKFNKWIIAHLVLINPELHAPEVNYIKPWTYQIPLIHLGPWKNLISAWTANFIKFKMWQHHWKTSSAQKFTRIWPLLLLFNTTACAWVVLMYLVGFTVQFRSIKICMPVTLQKSTGLSCCIWFVDRWSSVHNRVKITIALWITNIGEICRVSGCK